MSKVHAALDHCRRLIDATLRSPRRRFPTLVRLRPRTLPYRNGVRVHSRRCPHERLLRIRGNRRKSVQRLERTLEGPLNIPGPTVPPRPAKRLSFNKNVVKTKASYPAQFTLSLSFLRRAPGGGSPDPNRNVFDDRPDRRRRREEKTSQTLAASFFHLPHPPHRISSSYARL